MLFIMPSSETSIIIDPSIWSIEQKQKQEENIFAAWLRSAVR